MKTLNYRKRSPGWRLTFIFAATLSAVGLCAFAQEGQTSGPFPRREPGQSGPTGPPDRREGPGRFPPPDSSFLFMSSGPRFGGKTVKGAPYSAVTETEMVQTLADGSRIVRKTTANVYRDSEGRTRREQTLQNIGPLSASRPDGEGPPSLVFINDPVAGVNYTLDPRRRTARKMTFRGGAPPPPMRRDAPEVKTESLGKQTIEGVEADGTRSTITIPAGQIGNERALDIISEHWYSTALQEVVLSKYHDPRFGEHTYRLKNINRSEPAHSLFELPADYTVSEGRPFGDRGKPGMRKHDDR
jgi:hypothetical protein